MVIEKSVRKLIKSHYDDGKSAEEINSALNGSIKKRTIYNWIKRIKQTNAVEAKKQRGRPRSVTTKTLVDKVKRNSKLNVVKKSARQLGRENSCDPKTIRNIIHNRLGLKTYRRRKCQPLNSSAREKRKSFGGWIRKNPGVDFLKRIMFSDEKMFDGDGQMNPKNDVIYAQSRNEADSSGGLVELEKFPLKVMCWCAITFYGVCKPVFLPPKTSFNADFYVSQVIPVVRAEGEKLIGSDFLYQQDGARAHTSKKSIEAFQKASISLLKGGDWPPNSPDLNPMDYFFWNQVAKHVPKRKYSNHKELAREIEKSIKRVPLKMIQDSILNFRSRCRAVENENGGLIKNKFY